MPKKTLVITEKALLTDILLRYKEMTTLWDPSDKYYANKIKRKKQYEELLQRFRLYMRDANINDLKRKLEHMRTTYKREYGKVLKSRITGGEIYKPTLWYYNLLLFLDEHQQDDEYSLERDDIQEAEEDYDVPSVKIEKIPETPLSKKMKNSDNNSIYMEEEHLDDSYSLNMDESNSRQGTSADAFGRTVGMQLGELHPMQRFIAEKLISDVIFYGRLEKLTTETELQFICKDELDL